MFTRAGLKTVYHGNHEDRAGRTVGLSVTVKFATDRQQQDT